MMRTLTACMLLAGMITLWLKVDKLEHRSESMFVSSGSITWSSVNNNEPKRINCPTHEPGDKEYHIPQPPTLLCWSNAKQKFTQTVMELQ